MPSLTRHDVTVAYREWLLQVAKTEAADGRRLRGILSERPLCFVQVTRTWPVEKREAALRALTKQCRLGIEPSPLSPEEVKELEAWSWSPSERTAAHAIAALRAGMVTGEYRIDRRKLRRTVLDAVGQTLGAAHTKSGVMCWVTKLELVTVNTYVDAGGMFQLRYWHNVVRGTWNEPTTLVSDAIVLSDVGMSNMVADNMTHWDAMRDADVPASASHLAALCAEFVEAVPNIIRAT